MATNGKAETQDVAEDVRKLRGLNIRMDDGLSRLGVITEGLDPKKLSNIFKEAEMPGDLQRLMELYRKIEKYDGKIQGFVDKRRKAPTRYKWHFKNNYPDIEGTSQISDELEIIFRTIDTKKLMRKTVNGILYGVQLMENVWVKQSNDKIVFKDPIPISTSRYGQYNEVFGQNDPQWGKLYIRGGRSFLDRRFIDRYRDDKIYKAIYDGEKGFYDLGGIMRPAIKWYLMKYFAYQYWIEFDETYGFPTTILTIPRNDYYTFQNELTGLMEDIGRNKFGILFDGMEYKINAQGAAGQPTFFSELIKKVNDEISFTILGHNLSEKTTQGSYASNVVGYDMDTDLIIDDSEFVDRCINDNLVKNYIRLNYKNVPVDAVELYTNTPERKDWTKIKQKWELASKLGLEGVSKRQLAEELEINFATDASDSIDLIWQQRQETFQEGSEERKDGGSVADDEGDGNSIAP